ncbi:MAG: hypothetical protein ACKOI2_01430 [Actinomycetota bacterium]
MSLTEISVRVAIVTVLALVALVAIGWRRSAPEYPRRPKPQGAARPTTSGDTPSRHGAFEIEHVGRLTTRKVLDLVGLGSIAAFVGIMVALLTASIIAWMVTALLNRL